MDRRNHQVAELLQRAAAAQREADAFCAQAAALLRQRRAQGRTREGVVRRCYPAVTTSVPLARAAVARLARRGGMTPDQLDAVRLAVSEAVTNVVVHAYPSSTGPIHVTAVLTADELTVLIADDGVGPRSWPQRPGAGWGWPLLSSSSDVMTISQRANGGTLVEIRWQIGRTAPADVPAAALTADSPPA